MSTVERSLADELRELAGPLRERLARTESELAVAETIVRGLRDDRDQVRRALRAVDPTFEPESKPGPKGKKGRKQSTASASEAVLAKLRELAVSGELNGNGFTASEMSRRPGWPHSQSYTSSIFNELHERGVLRLDRKGGPTGNAKLYVLV